MNLGFASAATYLPNRDRQRVNVAQVGSWFGGVEQFWCNPSQGALGTTARQVCGSCRRLVESGRQAKVGQSGIVIDIYQDIYLMASTVSKLSAL
jgi:hypothetical protein